MSIATQAQKTTQASIMAQTATPTTNPLVMAFARFTSMVAGKPCTQASHPNGHITQANAGLCAQTRAEEFLSTLPSDTTEDQALAALGKVQILTVQRFMCLSTPTPEGWTQGQALPQKCKFGHKTQAQADKCVGTQASTQAKVASKIQVTFGGALTTQAQTTQTTQATPEATQQTPEGTQASTQAKPTQAKPRLASGSQGATGKA
jgi:hypothetical protein